MRGTITKRARASPAKETTRSPSQTILASPLCFPSLPAMTERHSITAFSVITLLPIALLTVTTLAGGGWAWLALGYLTVLTYALDQIIAAVAPAVPDSSEFPAADGLSVCLALAHVALLPMGVYAVLTAGGLHSIAAFLAFGLFFGQVSNSNAHELIHRGNKTLHTLGKIVFISLLFGHHTSAHPLVHHQFVATVDDPNSARFGEGFYRFALRAWKGSFAAGWRAEQARQARRNTPAPLWQHPYAHYLGGAAVCLLLAWGFGGFAGLLVYLGLAGHAQGQLLLSDYVQHYGLQRQQTESGTYEPVSERHSWNAPHWFSGFLMLNAPRHSDHHAHPARHYPALTLPGAAPMLPLSLPAMATLALFPSQWRRVMDRRALKWQHSET